MVSGAGAFTIPSGQVDGARERFMSMSRPPRSAAGGADHRRLGAGDEQAWSLGLGMQLVATPEIGAKGVDGGGVEWQLTRFAEFAQPHGEQTLAQVEIIPVEADGLATRMPVTASSAIRVW